VYDTTLIPRVLFVSLSKIFLFYFGNVPTVWYFFFHFIYRINMNKVQLMRNYVSILQRKFVMLDCKTCIFLLIIDIYMSYLATLLYVIIVSVIFIPRCSELNAKCEIVQLGKPWYEWFVTWSHAISHLGRWLLHCSSGWVWEPLRLTTHK
jgi:hypothetical protein